MPPRLIGSYYMRTERADLPPELVDEPAGINLLLLGPAHHGFARVADRIEHTWPVCVSGATLRFPASESGVCAGRGSASYRWRLAGDELRLTRVADGCPSRVFANTARPLRRFNASGFNCRNRPDCDHKLEQITELEKTGSCASVGCSE